MGVEVFVDFFGDEWKGYIFCIIGGNDKQGFLMKQGVIVFICVCFFFFDGYFCYCFCCIGECKCKFVCGCIVGVDFFVFVVVIVKQGEQEIFGFIDIVYFKCFGFKCVIKICCFFGFSKDDDVCVIFLVIFVIVYF